MRVKDTSWKEKERNMNIEIVRPNPIDWTLEELVISYVALEDARTSVDWENGVAPEFLLETQAEIFTELLDRNDQIALTLQADMFEAHLASQIPSI